MSKRGSTRSAGILLHPTSLPGPFGIGDLGYEAEQFLQWAAEAGQRIWQILPLGPTGWGNSPYGAISSHAGNPLLISPARLADDGLLRRSELESFEYANRGKVSYDEIGPAKERLLRFSWDPFLRDRRHPLHVRLEAFRSDIQQQHWLRNWALFATLKRHHRGKPWLNWDRELSAREPAALAKVERELATEIEYHEYVQFLFFRHWEAVRSRANSLGIKIMGDLPIYVALDSDDVWSAPDHFLLETDGTPSVVAGVPPDYFSKTGQLWGNPIYRWDRMRESGYLWWLSRIRAALQLADVVRLDHFRGFVAYWEVPAGETTAIKGQWRKGPGGELFVALRNALGELPLVAEDLGEITPDVEALREKLDLPGMRVLQFGFGSVDNIHLPHHYTQRTVVYTGTHDNDTLRGWFAAAPAKEKKRAVDYLGLKEDEIEWDFIRAAYNSVADMAIVPVQDILGLDSSARMNVPGGPDGNWEWRLTEGQLRAGKGEKLKLLAELSGRWKKSEEG